MSDEPDQDRDPETPPSPGCYSQDVRHTAVGARVPERIGRGVFTTASMILQTHEEFVIDFLSTMTAPQQVVARVAMTAGTFGQFVAALRANIGAYEQGFGRLQSRQPHVPRTPRAPEAATGGEPGAMGSGSVDVGAHGPGSREPGSMPPAPDISDLYDQLKLPDDMLGPAYANVIMIRHTPEEFSFDFIANFYPRPVVTARIYMAAGRVPSFLEAMANSFQKYRERFGRGMPPPPDSTPQ